MGLEEFEQDIPALGSFKAGYITRGICRYLRNLGYSPLTEYKLLTRRRADCIGVNKAGQFILLRLNLRLPIIIRKLSEACARRVFF